MTARRPLLTAAAAGSVLLALWFVPSANATVEERTAGGAESSVAAPRQPGQDTAAEAGAEADQTGAQTRPAAQHSEQAQVSPGSGTADGADDELALADSGSVDTTPYTIGGTAFLGVGATLVTLAVRRSRGEIA